VVNSENVRKSGKKWGLSTLLENECFETTIPALWEEVLKEFNEMVYARACQYILGYDLKQCVLKDIRNPYPERNRK